MAATRRLRNRLLALLSGGVLTGPFTACSSDEDPNSLSARCSGRHSATQCFEPGTTHFNPGNIPGDAAPQTPTPVFDRNNCQVLEQVRDDCCNAAVTGPDFVNGQCCYGFCTGSCCGRPLLVDGAPLLPPLVLRDDWLDEVAVTLEGDAVDREGAGKAWLEDARMEHASIASFARFTLDLLAHGAPAELLVLAQRALGDEIRHARVCFAVASAYLGRKLGPGPLALAGVRPSTSLAAAAAAAVREGCIGETMAALALEERARGAPTPELRTLIAGIAADEADHSELAFRFVDWALCTGGAGVRAAVAAAFFSARPSSPSPAWDDVIAPCARALLPEALDQRGAGGVRVELAGFDAPGGVVDGVAERAHGGLGQRVLEEGDQLQA